MGRLGLWATLAIVLLSTVACGFEPMYGRSHGTNPMSAPVAAELSAVRIYAVSAPRGSTDYQGAERQGQLLRNKLVYSLTPYGEPDRPRYGLTISLQSSFGYTAPNRDGYTTVTQDRLTATYSLVNMADGNVIKTGTVQALTSARNLGPRYASVAAERDIEERGITELAASIVSQLSGWFASPANRVGQPIAAGKQPTDAASSTAPDPATVP